MMLTNNLLPQFGHMDAQIWRDTRYWNEEIDNLYKSHFPIFDYLFKTFGGHHMKPGDKFFMEANEFEELWQVSGLINDDFGSRDAIVSFNLAMMTQVNEIEKDRHIKANMIEFLEAFARACEKRSLAPPTEEEVSDHLLKLLLGIGRWRRTSCVDSVRKKRPDPIQENL